MKRGPEVSSEGRLATVVATHRLKDPDQAVDVHLADSLAALPMLDEALGDGGPTLVADIGSGAGLPGIPLAVARPAAGFELVEASQRKAEFLTRVVGVLQLSNVAVLRSRAEELPGQGRRDAYGAVVARAVAPLATLVEYAGPLLVEGGRLLAWKGARNQDEEAAGRHAASRVGLEPLDVLGVTPYRGSCNRHLHLYQKVRPCPPEFPRRVGVARRKPLG